MRRQIYSLLVENTSGVTSHISGLFARRGYNIDSFSAGGTTDSRFTRITIASTGEEQILEQIEKQLAKLEDVISVKLLDPEDSVYRELALLKVSAPDEKRQEIMSISQIFRAKIVDVSKDSLIIELTGSPSKVNAFIELLNEYGILELARTGATGLSRGSGNITVLD